MSIENPPNISTHSPPFPTIPIPFPTNPYHFQPFHTIPNHSIPLSLSVVARGEACFTVEDLRERIGREAQSARNHTWLELGVRRREGKARKEAPSRELVEPFCAATFVQGHL